MFKYLHLLPRNWHLIVLLTEVTNAKIDAEMSDDPYSYVEKPQKSHLTTTKKSTLKIRKILTTGKML